MVGMLALLRGDDLSANQILSTGITATAARNKHLWPCIKLESSRDAANCSHKCCVRRYMWRTAVPVAGTHPSGPSVRRNVNSITSSIKAPISSSKHRLLSAESSQNPLSASIARYLHILPIPSACDSSESSRQPLRSSPCLSSPLDRLSLASCLCSWLALLIVGYSVGPASFEYTVLG
jgi:hypothetical protein